MTSLHGADLFVETDCNTAGNCNGAGSETHLMVYNISCSPPWFDTTRVACRLP